MNNRQLNIEILRILAMLMVLGLHANFLALGDPPITDIIATPVSEVSRILLQSLCIMAVNVFVMISGWFGIHVSIKGFTKFIWQVFYIIGLSYAIEYLFFDIPITLKDVLRCFGLFGGGGWFVASYIGLYVISPVLNAFIEHSSVRQHMFVTIAFFAFEIIFGDTLSVEFIVMGYSTFSFIGLYLFAAVLRRISPEVSSLKCLAVLSGCVVTNAAVYMAAELAGFIAVRDLVFNYINPLVIISSASTVILFAGLSTPPVLRTLSICYRHRASRYIFSMSELRLHSVSL